MRVKRYVADSIQEAITRVKNDLGRNAIILHTKPFKEGGFLGLFCRRRFEVIAAVDENISENFLKKSDGRMDVSPSTNTVPTASQRNYLGTDIPSNQALAAPPDFSPAPVVPDRNLVSMVTPTPANAVTNPAVVINTPVPAVSPQNPVVPNPVPFQVLNPEPVSVPPVPSFKETGATSEPALKSLREEIAEVKELIRQVASKPSVVSTPAKVMEKQPDRSSSLELFRQRLQFAGLEGEIIEYLLLQIPSYLIENRTSEEELLDYCQQVLSAKLMFSEPILTDTSGEQQIVALIGPTGVGKTTTIAKLAANFNLFEGKKVGLITIDTYRIAAVEHLKTYGDIINLPVEVVYTPSDLSQSFQNLRDCDLILIDTAGRSPQNQVMMEELKKFLANDKIGIILLVVSATTKYQDMVVIAENFSRISFTHLVFTKLDETSCLGPIVSLAWKNKRPISYLTTGQNVPDDIEIARPEKLISQLFKGLTHG
jgi:flagellar biosynthesis protein FlhF